jgi:hypothetical protein
MLTYVIAHQGYESSNKTRLIEIWNCGLQYTTYILRVQLEVSASELKTRMCW